MAMNTDLKGLYFEYKIMPTIEGEPDFTQIHQLIRYPIKKFTKLNFMINYLLSNTND